MFAYKGLTNAINRVYRPSLGVDLRHPLARGLTYFRVLNNFNPGALYSQVEQNAVFVGTTGSIIADFFGPGLQTSSNSQSGFKDSSNKINIASKGTILAYVFQNWTPADSKKHYVAMIGQNNADSVKELHFLKYSDNLWYLGFYDGVNSIDYRVTVAASTISGAGGRYLIGFTWNLGAVGGLTAYRSSLVVGTPINLPGSHDVNHDGFYIGGQGTDNAAATSWGNGDGSAIHWLAMWDRMLLPAEQLEIALHPWCLLKTYDDRVFPQVEGGIQVTAGSGTTIAADDIGSTHSYFERMKIALGADGSATDALSGAGTVSAGVKRITLASDDPLVARLDRFATGSYETVAASQTDQALGVTGATGDFLNSILIVPATTSPGAVSIKDGSGSSITVFAGGQSSITNLFPFLIPLGIVSTSGAWKVTTGANVSAVCSGKFT
jgi:hypothetical protein